MEKSKISRSSFKNNFLKQIIMRLDFQGVLASEMEAVLEHVKPYLKDASFNRYDEKMQNEIELSVGNSSFMQEPIQGVSQFKIYSFMNEDAGYALDLSKAFVILKVNSAKYVSFEQYSKLFIDICNFYKNKIDFFTVKRFGFRKINFCFVKTIDSIIEYFNANYYNCVNLFENANVLKSIKQVNLFQDSYKFNILYGIEHGSLKNETTYKVILDSDIYCEEQVQIEDILFNKKTVSEQNDKLFDIYLDSLNEPMINILLNEDSDIPETILGVDKNE